MKTTITNTIKQIATDRHLMVVLGLLVITSVVFSIYVAFNLEPSELQVVTHYSSFGNTNFYRDKWYYLIGFIVFGLMNAVVYSVLACKIFVHKGRELAIPFAWLGVIVIIIATAIVYQVLKVASLS